MSLMTVHCEWCGQDYMFGIVGKQQIGGHDCLATKPCAIEGCPEDGVVQISANFEQNFVCWHHIPDDALILGVQARLATFMEGGL